jgi:hypothetical protein
MNFGSRLLEISLHLQNNHEIVVNNPMEYSVALQETCIHKQALRALIFSKRFDTKGHRCPEIFQHCALRLQLSILNTLSGLRSYGLNSMDVKILRSVISWKQQSR